MNDLPAGASAVERRTRVQYVVLALLCAAMANAYLCRDMSPINTTLEAELHQTEDGLKGVVAGFAFGYVWMQIPGGWLGSRFGARLVLPVIALGWSTCTLVFACGRDLTQLEWPRVGIGIFQGALIPCCAKVVADWFAPHQRGIASAAVTSSMQVGKLLGLLVTPLLMVWIDSWRVAYFIYGGLGIAWSIAFAVLFRDRPAEHPGVNAAERALLAPAAAATAPAAVNNSRSFDTALLLAILFTSSLIFINIQGFFRAFGYEFFQSWFPSYLEKARGMSKLNSSLSTMVPIVSLAMGGMVGGIVVDRVYRRTSSRWLSRSLVAAVALVVCAGCTLAAGAVASPSKAVLLIAVGTFFFGFTGPATWAAVIDVSGRHTGVISGVMNMCGNLGSLACAYSLGGLFTYIGKYKWDWNIVLYLFAGVYLCAAVAWLLLDPNRTVDMTAPQANRSPPSGT